MKTKQRAFRELFVLELHRYVVPVARGGYLIPGSRVSVEHVGSVGVPGKWKLPRVAASLKKARFYVPRQFLKR